MKILTKHSQLAHQSSVFCESKLGNKGTYFIMANCHLMDNRHSLKAAGPFVLHACITF